MFLPINMSTQACQPAAFQGTALKSDFFILPDVGCSCWHLWQKCSQFSWSMLGLFKNSYGCAWLRGP